MSAAKAVEALDLAIKHAPDEDRALVTCASAVVYALLAIAEAVDKHGPSEADMSFNKAVEDLIRSRRKGGTS